MNGHNHLDAQTNNVGWAKPRVTARGKLRVPTNHLGLGLRAEHYQEILNTKPNIGWFEAITENYLVPGGQPLFFLEKIRELYPIAFHGVSLSIGSAEPLDFEYLKQVKELAQRFQSMWISDHLCWTEIAGHNSHDLLPLPFNEETAIFIADKVKQVQDYFNQQILLENVSSYLIIPGSEMPEWEFVKLVAEKADCDILLDINNIYVNSVNHKFDPYEYIKNIPVQRVRQFHLAGHSKQEDMIIDTHDSKIIDPVWDLYAFARKRFGEHPVNIERDEKIPQLIELLEELKKIY